MGTTVALKNEGFTFLNIAPGLVDTSEAPPTEEELGEIDEMITAFKNAYPDWTPKPMTPAESVNLMLGIIDNLTVEDSGKFVSHKVSTLFVVPGDKPMILNCRITENGCSFVEYSVDHTNMNAVFFKKKKTHRSGSF